MQQSQHKAKQLKAADRCTDNTESAVRTSHTSLVSKDCRHHLIVLMVKPWLKGPSIVNNN